MLEMSKAYLVLMFLFLAFDRPAWLMAQDLERSRLDEINLKVEEEKSRLEEVKGKYLSLETELKGLRSVIEKLRQQSRSLEEELARKQESRRVVLRELEQTDRHMGRLKELSLERLRSFYVHRSARGVTGLIFMLLEDSSHLVRNAIYLARVQDYDRNLLLELAKLQKQRRQQQTELESLIQEQDRLQEKLKAQSAMVQQKITRHEGVLKALKAEQAEIQKVLTELRAQALRLEIVVSSLTGGPGDKTQERMGQKAPVSAGISVLKEPFQGRGLKEQRRSLTVPVMGRVLRSYGKQKLNEFDEIVLSKGLEFQVPVGAEVRAVADGRVIFLGRMPGYGTVLIVDHGQRSYSLYGRLGEVRVQAGQDVQNADVLAVSGEPDEKGRNFYFEIRENGAPVDPRKYFTRISALS